MINLLRARLRQGHRTQAFPPASNPLPERFRGLPILHPERCPETCRTCADACPTGAIAANGTNGGGLRLDLGRCLFCPACAEACPQKAVEFSNGYTLASTSREDLILSQETLRPKVDALLGETKRLLGRSLKLRQVSAGGCNGCEADLNVLSTVGFDLGRFGIQFVASPRHADGIVVTGPVTRNMADALRSTYEAVPAPKLVILSGVCALSGGTFAGSPAVSGMPGDIPVDLYIPGCPPHPLTVLDGLLRLLGRLPG
jgi:Ni,Fe-hydrogenase III small subunit/ferredoxin